MSARRPIARRPAIDLPQPMAMAAGSEDQVIEGFDEPLAARRARVPAAPARGIARAGADALDTGSTPCARIAERRMIAAGGGAMPPPAHQHAGRCQRHGRASAVAALLDRDGLLLPRTSAYACRIRSRTRSCAVASATGRSSAKLRRSPLTEYWRAGNVTFRPLPLRRSQTAKPISLSPSSGPSVKCSSASASLPGGLPLSFGDDFDLPRRFAPDVACASAVPFQTQGTCRKPCRRCAWLRAARRKCA